MVACVLVHHIHILKHCCRRVACVLEYEVGRVFSFVVDYEFDLRAVVHGLDFIVNYFLQCFFFGAVGGCREVFVVKAYFLTGACFPSSWKQLFMCRRITSSISSFLYPLLVNIWDTLVSSLLTVGHDEQCVKARLMKELITLRRYFSGYSLAALRQNPKFVDFT